MMPRPKQRAGDRSAPVRQQRSQHSATGQRRGAARGGGLAGPDGRQSWQKKRDHYLAQAQSALAAGDRVGAEYLFQHADHYFRMVQGTAA